MAKTTVLTAPYHPDGSLLHYPRDYHAFSHYEDIDTGERLERHQIWEKVPDAYERNLPLAKQIHFNWKIVHNTPEWRPNLPFSAAFQVDSLRSGRSAKYVILRPISDPLDKRTFPMFVADLIEVAQVQGIAVGGLMNGRWMVAKRGQNYGLRIAKEGE